MGANNMHGGAPITEKADMQPLSVSLAQLPVQPAIDRGQPVRVGHGQRLCVGCAGHRAVHRVPAPLHVERSRIGGEGLIPYRLSRLGTVMTPDPDDPFEAEGVLNPAAGYTPDGRLHLLPRLVAAGNVSRCRTRRGRRRARCPRRRDPSRRRAPTRDAVGTRPAPWRGRGSPRHVCRAARDAHHDVRGVRAARPADCRCHLT